MNRGTLLAAFFAAVVLAAAAGAAAAPPPLGPYAVIVTRDPFDPERGKGALAPGAAELSGTELASRYRVEGTVIAGARRQAFLRDTQGGDLAKVRVVAVGDVLEGYRVTAITAKTVELVGPEGRMVLRVFARGRGEGGARRPVGIATPRPAPPSPGGTVKKGRVPPPPTAPGTRRRAPIYRPPGR
ncbi:hypothetical protein G3N55_06920 [Dissulfurirhabdus thermomarina]|uniref:Type II secretion system protein GspC N-terminal domain-containing protein n=1 Tax=Dissulfurirhabdus thermomarina TaxID=1765737 RepID=A0A6N9TR43_DISTH|nr:hypothetical protein [Dissulfurirhabdus thermomarina]NDY42573.1 hypothetical protein [Dissulfurirhabdus thermomarina]NMX22506.1 hypothetical protein [Dissulfurirhabdus thermomarina]